jgi:dipeptidase
MWFTFGQPCISPFLPFYIGINEVPQIASTRANPLARVFEDLRLALEYHPEYMADINRYFTVFEQQTIEQSKELENDVKQLNDNGKETEARAQLTEFVARKCDEALSIGSEWLKFLKSCTINTEKVDRGKSASPGSEKSSKGPIE